MKAKPTFDVAAFLAAYDRLDAVLVKAGFPATSPWWRAQIERFFRARRRRWVIRAGRRAGKSSTLCRLAACWALAGPWSVPLGDTAVIPFVSLDRDEAAGRIRTISEILTALGVPHEPTSDEIYLPSRRLKFSVRTCSVRAVGFTSVAIFADEMARWSSRDDSANPAREVMGSLRPTAATQPFAFEVCSSSAWSTVDYHAELFAQGCNEHQITSFAATWTANPTITELDTYGLEPDENTRLREYAGEPSTILTKGLNDPALVRAARTRKIPSWFHKRGAAAICFDASAGHPGGDAFAWAIMQWWEENPLETFLIVRAENARGCEVRISPRTKAPIRRLDRPEMAPILRVEFCDKLDAPFHDTWAPSRIAKRIAADGSRFGCRDARGDQWSEHSYQEHLKNQGIRMFYHPLTATSKVMACQMLRQWLDAGVLAIADSPAADDLCHELSVYQETMTAAGTMRYSAPSGQHDDLVACLLQASLSMQSDNPRERIGGKSARGTVTEDASGRVIFLT
jgi:hypothetical protein